MFGIKLPWGPSISDEKWIKGRRLVGYFWIIIGITYIIVTFLFKADFFVYLIRLIITLVILYTAPILYAYFIYLLGKGKIAKV